MSFSLTKGYPPIHPQYKSGSIITRVWMEKDCEVVIKGNETKSDLVMITYKTKHGEITTKYLPYMNENTDLGQVVKAINGGIIPVQIKDCKKFFVGKEIGIEVKHNISNKTGRTFANVLRVYSLDEEDVDQDEDDVNDYDDDEMTGEGSDDDTDNDEEELDWDEDPEETSDDSPSDEDLDLDEEFDEDDLPKQPIPRRRRSTWTNHSYEDQRDDFTD